MEIVIRPVDQARRIELPSLAEGLRRPRVIEGQIAVSWSEAPSDRLGPVPEAVSVAIAAAGAGGAITVTVRELVRVLLGRRTDLDVDICSDAAPEPKLHIHVREMRRMSADELAALIDRLAASLRDVAGLSTPAVAADAPYLPTDEADGMPG